MRVLQFILPLMALVFVAGCDLLEAGDGYQPQVVVSAALEADRPLPPIHLRWTISADQPYDPEQVTISDAVVQVIHEDTERVIDFLIAADGSYEPRGTHIVVPEGTYRLEAHVPGATDPITAVTHVPARFNITEPPPQSLPYGTGQGPEVSIMPNTTAGRPAVYLLQTRALAADSFILKETTEDIHRWHRAKLDGRYGMTPFFQEIFRTVECSPERDGTFTCDLDPADIVISTLPIANEARYDVNPDGSLLIRVPWLGFAYYGPHEVTIRSLDAALEDFLQTQGIQQPGGSNLSPGEIPNITTNIRGGLGVFGASASQRVMFDVTE